VKGSHWLSMRMSLKAMGEVSRKKFFNILTAQRPGGLDVQTRPLGLPATIHGP
jgi:hypothetical protein